MGRTATWLRAIAAAGGIGIAMFVLAVGGTTSQAVFFALAGLGCLAVLGSWVIMTAPSGGPGIGPNLYADANDERRARYDADWDAGIRVLREGAIVIGITIILAVASALL